MENLQVHLLFVRVENTADNECCMSPAFAACPFPALVASDSRKAKPASMSPAAAFSRVLSCGRPDVPEPASLGARAREGVAAFSAHCATAAPPGGGAAAATTGIGRVGAVSMMGFGLPG